MGKREMGKEEEFEEETEVRWEVVPSPKKIHLMSAQKLWRETGWSLRQFT